jgi:hypothetical protein
MSSDYKGEIQQRAEDIAMDRWGCEFQYLPESTRFSIFNEATEAWSEAQAAIAEQQNDRQKEGN